MIAEATTNTTINKHKKQTSKPSAGFEPATPAIKQFQTYTLDHSATQISSFQQFRGKYWHSTFKWDRFFLHYAQSSSP